LGIGPNPQSPIPNPQSPIPNPQRIYIIFYDNLIFNKFKLYLINKLSLSIIINEIKKEILLEYGFI